MEDKVVVHAPAFLGGILLEHIRWDIIGEKMDIRVLGTSVLEVQVHSFYRRLGIRASQEVEFHWQA